MEIPLPKEIESGIKDVSRRDGWNKPAKEEFALPTETWREVVARRQRYAEVRAKLANGEVRDINDLVTLNLNLGKFIEDVILDCRDPELLTAIYYTIAGRIPDPEKQSNQEIQPGLSVLDITCGSGAFLFAALNILYPIYESCLSKMQEFLDAEAGNATRKHSHFRRILDEVAEHPNARYFILKSIIVNNLFGVDIMEEAVEICKLRLFLKLAAQVDADPSKENLGVEPLPDIDFNIRAGNTLVGYATRAEVEKSAESDMLRKMALPQILEDAETTDRAFKLFRQLQTRSGATAKEKAQSKSALQQRLTALEDQLNCFLAEDYQLGLSTKKNAFEAWLKSHQPFHWFIEFYGILHAGGFDVIIANPPYVENGAKLQSQYQVRNYATLSCGNLHAFCAERSLVLSSKRGRIGLIVPLPSINTDRMTALQSIVKPQLGAKGRSLWVSAFDERPSNLFSGVDQRLVIEIFGAELQQPGLATTGINRWAAKTRDNLFPNIFYSAQDHQSTGRTRTILKIKNVSVETSLLAKLYSNDPIERFRSMLPTKNLVAYRTAGGRYWKVVLDVPFESEALSGKVAYLQNLSGRQAVALISSSTFWWYYSCHFDMYNLKDYMIFGFRFSKASQQVLDELDSLGRKLVKSLEYNAEVQTMQSQTRGVVEQKIYNAGKSKLILDEIDGVLARHYGFTAEELDFILNYDIKYRLGRNAESDDE